MNWGRDAFQRRSTASVISFIKEFGRGGTRWNVGGTRSYHFWFMVPMRDVKIVSYQHAYSEESSEATERLVTSRAGRSFASRVAFSAYARKATIARFTTSRLTRSSVTR